MRDARQPFTPTADLGTRILARYRARRGFIRPRAPLVLRRFGAPARAGMMPRHMCVAASHYHLALQLHLSMLSGPSAARHRASPESERRDAALRTLLALAGPVAAARNAGAVGAAPRHHAAAPSSHTLGPAASTTASPNRSTTSAATAFLVSRQPGAPASLPNAGLDRKGAANAPDAIARRVTLNGRNGLNGSDRRSGRDGSSHSVFTETVAHEHRRHVVETTDTTSAVPRLNSSAKRTPRESARPSARTVAHDPSDSQGRPSGRTAASRALRAVIPAPFPPVLMALPRSSAIRQRDERSTLYAQPASRSLAVAPVAAQAQPAPPEPRSTPVPAPPVQMLPPPIDVGQLSEDVYQHIQRRIRIERERRGL